MNTERQRQHTEDRRAHAEGERQISEHNRADAENKRAGNEQKRQVGEKHREVGEQLRETERTGERLVVEYSTRSLLIRIAGFEEHLSQLAARLGSIEILLKAMHEQLQQLMTKK